MEMETETETETKMETETEMEMRLEMKQTPSPNSHHAAFPFLPTAPIFPLQSAITTLPFPPPPPLQDPTQAHNHSPLCLD